VARSVNLNHVLQFRVDAAATDPAPVGFSPLPQDSRRSTGPADD
jgi:hypothetical protein